jgi:mRNA interferase RelE/StbE
MARYVVRILKEATRELERLDKAVGRRITQRINWLAKNLENINFEGLKGDLAGFYKLREGDYRIIYEILHDEQAIIIHSIGHRREVYRKK